jgi:carboxyl-terminal processing protease
MREKRAISVLLAILIFLLPIVGGGCAYIVGKATPATSTTPNVQIIEIGGSAPGTASSIDSKLPADFNVVNEAWQALNQRYVDKSKLDPKKLSQGAVRGMMQSLDQFSSYADPDTHKLETTNLSGKFEGIGATITMKDNQLTVVSPIIDSPAEKAGIKAGDRILEIDGQRSSTMSLVEATFKIRGPKGTTVTLLILHDGDTEPVEISIVRAEITGKSVSMEMRDEIAYIRITQFLQTTANDLKAVLIQAINQGAKGIILDLRNNTGGLLISSEDVASQFLTMGIVAKVVDGSGMESVVPVRPDGIGTHLPMVVLVNEVSASASEIVAGALQDYGRAKLIGTKTYGKGSVQIIYDLSDGSALHITAYKWLTPFGRPIDGVGLTPDIPSDLKDEALVDWAVQYLKDTIKAEVLEYALG